MTANKPGLEALAMLGLALVVAVLLMSTRLDAPFDGGHIGLTGAWYSLAARNFELYGPTKLYFCLSTSSGPVVEHPDLYLSHPGGISVWLYAVFSVFGEGELQARLAALTLSLGAVVFFFLFQRRLWHSSGLALFGTLLAITAPVWSIYGSLIDPHGPGILLSMGAALWATLRWHDSQRPSDLLLAFALRQILQGYPVQRRLILSCAASLVLVCLSWAWYRAGLRWSMDQDRRAECQQAGERIQADTEIDEVVLSDCSFFAPIGWYGERTIVWLAGWPRTSHPSRCEDWWGLDEGAPECRTARGRGAGEAAGPCAAPRRKDAVVSALSAGRVGTVPGRDPPGSCDREFQENDPCVRNPDGGNRGRPAA